MSDCRGRGAREGGPGEYTDGGGRAGSLQRDHRRPLHAPSLRLTGFAGPHNRGVRLQGLPAMGLEREAMRNVLMEVAELAAYSSVVVGELPRMTRSEAEDLLGEAGMLGTLQPESICSPSTPDASR